MLKQTIRAGERRRHKADCTDIGMLRWGDAIDSLKKLRFMLAMSYENKEEGDNDATKAELRSRSEDHVACV